MGLCLFCHGRPGGLYIGVPKIITNNSSPDAAALKAGAPNTNRKVIQENTNLTQVSDWLTKVIIGAGLVQLKEIPAFILKIARRMSEGIAVTQQNLPSVTILSAGIILYFATWGFVSGYLIMRLVITDLLANDSLEGESQ